MSTSPIFTNAPASQPQPLIASQSRTQETSSKKRIHRVEESSVDPAPVTRVSRRVRAASPPIRAGFDFKAIIDQMNKLAVEDCCRSDSDSETSAKPAAVDQSDSDNDTYGGVINP